MNDVVSKQWFALASDAVKLGDSKFLKIFHLLEQLHEKPGIQGAFDAMRPRLVELRPPRKPSASRLFFRPIEDLLDDASDYARKLNRVSRAILPICWREIKERVDPGTLDTLTRELAAIAPHDAPGMARITEPLWKAGAVAMADVIARCGVDLKFKVDNFGRDDDALRQLETIRGVIEIGPELEALKLKLPERPIGEMAESHADAIKSALTALGRDDVKRTAPMMLALSARMRRPGDLLKMLADIRLGGAPGDKDELSKELSGYVVGNLLRQTTNIEQAGAGGGDAIANLATQAERLTEGLSSVNDTITALRDKHMTEKVASARTEIGDFVVRTIVSDIDKVLMDALTVQVEDPDMAVVNVKKAEQLGLALRRASKLAPFLGIQRQVAAKIADVRKQVDQHIDAMLVDDGGHNRPELQRRMAHNLRLVEILAGSDEAERVYRTWKLRVS